MSIQKTDEQLILEVKNGDLDSLAPLFEKYHVRLFNFFLRMTNDRSISEDLTQNVFQRVLTYRESYNEKWMFRSWMYQIARNAASKHYNNQKLLIDEYSEVNHMAYESDLAVEELDAKLQKEHLHLALAKLSYEQREIIELAKFQELKYKEIAEITGNTVPAIKVKVHRAIQRLRELFFEIA